MGFSFTWGWSEFPDEEELASPIAQFTSGQAEEITFSSSFYAELSVNGFRIETGDAEFKLPATIGYAFFKDLVEVYGLGERSPPNPLAIPE